MNLFDNNGAEFSKCGKYRYRLWRIWDINRPLAMFIGLNPSTANAETDDPTIKRVKSICISNGLGGFYMMNLFSYITPYPDELKINIHPTNDMKRLIDVSEKVSVVVFAWGNFNVHGRDKMVSGLFPDAKALFINKNGSPKHPLYCKSDSKLIPFT